MKVLIINTVPFRQNGMSHMILNYYRCLHERVTFDFAINSHIDKELREVIKAPSQIFLLPNRKKKMLSYIRELRKIVQENDYDIIHIHGNSALMSLELMILKGYTASHLIVHNHSVQSNYGIFDKVIRPYFYNNLPTSFAASKEAGEWLYGPRKFSVIENGIDIQKMVFSSEKRNLMRQKLNLNDNQTLILNVGLFNPPKNKEFVVRSFGEYLKKDPSAMLLLLGGGKGRREIIQLVKQLGIDNSTIFIERTMDIQSYYSAADLFSFPSLFESLGMVVVEAQLTGLPCVVSEHVPHVTEISNCITYQSIQEPSIWAEEMYKMRQRFPKRSGNWDSRMKRFDIQKNAADLEEKYRQIASSREEYK